MSYASDIRKITPRKAMTLLELLIALTIMLIITMSCFVFMFSQVKSINKKTQQRFEALQAARYALDDCCREINIAYYYGTVDAHNVGTNPYFVADTDSDYLGHGNRCDDDNDGLIDEELFDGVSNETQPWQDSYNQHAVISPDWRERRDRATTADFGDLHFDVDNHFSSSTLTFRTNIDPEDPTVPGRRYVTLGLETYNGKNNVLVKTVRTYNAALELIDTHKFPLAENVISFGALMREDDNHAQPWTKTWDTTKQDVDDSVHKHMHIPIAVSFEITVLEGSTVPDSGPIDSVTLRCIANCTNALTAYRKYHSNHIRNYAYPY